MKLGGDTFITTCQRFAIAADATGLLNTVNGGVPFRRGRRKF